MFAILHLFVLYQRVVIQKKEFGGNMPFAEEFLNTATREIESKYLATDFDRARGFIMEALKKCAAVEPSIKLDDVDIYMHGSYANKSNIYFPSNLEIMVEITTTKRFSPEEVSLQGNYFVDIPLVFGPKEFRELFTEMLTEMVGDKLIEQPKCIRLTNLEKIKHDVDITPCITFHHYQQEGKRGETEVSRTRGILLHDTSIVRNIVSFPRLHAQNGFEKDQATGGNFKRMVRLFKTLHSLNVNEFSFISPNTANGYFIECLLYNVPNSLFADASALARAHQNTAAVMNEKALKEGQQKSGEEVKLDIKPLPQSLNEIFNKIINYLVNEEMDEFVCQNLVWELFGDAAEFWDKKRAEEFIGSIIHLFIAFPVSRIFLA